VSGPRPLFVCGCARSGTTALAQLVGSHPRVLLGIERYGRLARDRFLLEARHLEPARFARIEDGDTFYSSFEGRHYWDDGFADKLAGAVALAYVGDKKPMLYRFWRELFERFPDARLLFIYREPLAVARSWERRARAPGGNWPPGRDAAAAISEWNRAAACIRAAARQQQSVCIVSYEGLLSEGWAERIFSWLQLPLTRVVGDAREALLEAHAVAEAQRGRPAPLALDEEALGAAVDVDSLAWLEAHRQA